MADDAHGGKQGDTNYIPNLTALALNNTSFGSSSTVLGGALSMPNTGWTSAALIATTAGIPFSYPIADNDLQQYGSFAEKLQNLGTILDANGYTQEFLCGSDGTFGGRSQYFSQHGNYRIFDYYYAIRNGFYPEDYYTMEKPFPLFWTVQTIKSKPFWNGAASSHFTPTQRLSF